MPRPPPRGWRGLGLGLCLGLLARAAAAAALEDSACRGLDGLQNTAQVRACADEAYEGATEKQQRATKKSLGALEEAREACTASPEKATTWGCKALTDLSYEIFIEAATVLRTCQVVSEAECDERGRQGTIAVATAWQVTEARFVNTPAEAMVTNKLRDLRAEHFGLLQKGERIGDEGEAMPPVWHVGASAVYKIKHWVCGYVWRETHWLWLMDSLAAGEVVQTAWGDADEWLKFGVHDAHSAAPLGRPFPRYQFNDRLGMRWEIMVELIKELRDLRGGGEIQVVEVGVFAGHLSHHLLKDLDFIHLLGVDPYIGSDGTFPGNFSDTLDSDVALYKAMSVMEAHGDRAQLWPMTSEKAAANIPDGSVDCVFIDGCHLYDCVVQDLQTWIPKMRRGAPVLVAGHDFSPQWPGVVRAVHEHRAGGAEVQLASDWMWWYFEQFEE